MIPIIQRNQLIIEMCRNGASTAEVSRVFKVSPGRVWQIVTRSERDQVVALRCSAFLQRVRQADDLDRSWPMLEFMEALRLPTATYNYLKRHWDGRGSTSITLREVMDLISLPTGDPSQSFGTTPLFRVCGIGKYGYRFVVDGLSNFDLGEKCQREWEQRLKLLEIQGYYRHPS